MSPPHMSFSAMKQKWDRGRENDIKERGGNGRDNTKPGTNTH